MGRFHRPTRTHSNKPQDPYRVGSVHRDLVLGRISDKTLGLIEGNVRWGGTVTLVVRDNLHAVVLPAG